ncbi:hypothetical protein DINM_007213 [Dirofilaria immitis]|nr:hypothetical protein [Dirofilaria immitis]
MDENDLKPLMTTSSSVSSAIKKVWPCRSCGLMLGICHLLSGIILLIFDVITNNISGTAFAITASLSFIICGIFSFISSRRLDRPAQLLLLLFSIFSMAMSITMFVDSAALINNNCDQDDCHEENARVSTRESTDANHHDKTESDVASLYAVVGIRKIFSDCNRFRLLTCTNAYIHV